MWTHSGTTTEQHKEYKVHSNCGIFRLTRNFSPRVFKNVADNEQMLVIKTIKALDKS